MTLQTKAEPVIKMKMRRLIKQGAEKEFSRLFDELLEQKDVILLETRQLNETIDARCTTYIQFIEDLYCTHFNVANADIYKRTRVRDIMSTRQVVMWTIRRTYDLSIMSIGRRYGKDHATVLHACKAVEGRLSTERMFRDVIVYCVEQMKLQGFDNEAAILENEITNIKPLFR